MKRKEIQHPEKPHPALSCTNPRPRRKTKRLRTVLKIGGKEDGKIVEVGLRLQFRVYCILVFHANTAVYIPP